MTTAPARKLTVPVTELEQSAFCRSDANLRTKTLEEEFRSGVRWQRIPVRYLKMSPSDVDASIAEARAAIGKTLVILGHHYQRDDVIKYADFRGDSYLLSKMAAQEKSAEFVVFCGVHFMAETASILTEDYQKVMLPNMAAGCSMADMALIEDVEECWDEITSLFGKKEKDLAPVVPLTYMNSTASIKSLCGMNGGAVCTSSNAARAMRWAFERGKRVLFLPDQHLGRNTALTLGMDEADMAVWNPFAPLGGLTPETLKRSKLILWKGHCSVHTRFTVQQVEQSRERYPNVKVLVHPECTREVVDAADMNGSTEFIRKTVEESEAGTVWAIGTEINMVKRLGHENPDKTIFCLDPIVCPCATMYRIHPAYLLWILDGLQAGMLINSIEVVPEIKENALKALQRMLQFSA